MMTKKNRLHFIHIIPNALLLIFSASCIFPLVWLVYSSFKTKSEFYQNPVALPEHINFSYYQEILTNSKFMVWVWNSLRNSLIALFFILLFGFVIGYLLSRYKFAGRKSTYTFFLLGMLIPVHAIMVPMYVMFTKLHLTDQWFTLVLPYTAMGLPLAVFLVESYVKTIPVEVEEAAAIDGCSRERTIFSIVLFMCKPILVTIGIIQFFGSWNEFTFALILTNSEKYMTLPVGIALFKGQFTTNYPRMMTSMLLAILPAMMAYFIFSKHIIKGMVAGAVKG